MLTESLLALRGARVLTTIACRWRCTVSTGVNNGNGRPAKHGPAADDFRRTQVHPNDRQSIRLVKNSFRPPHRRGGRTLDHAVVNTEVDAPCPPSSSRICTW